MRSVPMRSGHESRSNIDTPNAAQEIVQELVCVSSRSTARKNSGDVVLFPGSSGKPESLRGEPVDLSGGPSRSDPWLGEHHRDVL